MAFVEIRALNVSYGATQVVHDVSLDIARGEFLALLGPSGCGKTTILRAISGLLEPSSGAIRVAGADVVGLPVHRRNLGYVFQNYALFPHMSVAGNVGFGLKMRRLGRGDSDRRVGEVLELVRMAALSGRKPKQLSGGQQQRVALARALVIEPQLLLLDECLSNLDAKLREELRGEIRDIQKRTGVTTLFVTHDQTEAMTMCDRIAILDQGRIVQVGAPREVYEHPNSPFVARFIGRINELAGLADGAGGLSLGDTRLALPDPERRAGPVTIMIRPHRISVSAAGDAAGQGAGALLGSIIRKTFVGNMVEIMVRTVAGNLLAESIAGSADLDRHRPGDAVSLSWRATDMTVFDREVAT
jgi:putative spermidine/putrescine transport system ATP-binding protein